MTVRRWGVMGECDARTQGAADMGHIWATEDEAACRPARSGGTSLISIRVLTGQTRRNARAERSPGGRLLPTEWWQGWPVAWGCLCCLPAMACVSRSPGASGVCCGCVWGLLRVRLGSAARCRRSPVAGVSSGVCCGCVWGLLQGVGGRRLPGFPLGSAGVAAGFCQTVVGCRRSCRSVSYLRLPAPSHRTRPSPPRPPLGDGAVRFSRRARSFDCA